ncbi:hypothetical protein GCM10010832_26290 [Psychroflexus planctonicus]|uniref:Uncharacterized protein n=1 Tax=Psychroflexus planctonicus TaxID=1526575 RepID=A0ABQ1SNB6_9FLAO|nr:hypothetical protein GCM10010832_26290 [Psychroflexus planctonicus]
MNSDINFFEEKGFIELIFFKRKGIAIKTNRLEIISSLLKSRMNDDGIFNKFKIINKLLIKVLDKNKVIYR